MSDAIDTMSGPELAAAVASEVMGCHEKIRNDWWGYYGDATFVLKDWRPHESVDDAIVLLRHCHWRRILTEMKLEDIDPEIVCRAALRAVRSAKLPTGGSGGAS